MARPLSLTPAIANLICGILEQGQPESDAYKAAGVEERTFFFWKANGAKAAKKAAKRGATLTENETILFQFFQAVEKARATGKTSLVKIISDYARDTTKPRNWHAAAWLLERQHAAEFGRKYIKIETNGLDDALPGAGGDVVVNVTIQGTGKPPEAPPAPERPARK